MKYCKKCGKELHDQAVICPSCKQAITFNVVIKRESQFFLVNPSIKIDVDGQKLAEVKNGERISIELPSGMHKLHFYASMRKADCNINLNGDVYLLLGWNRFTGGLEVFETSCEES